jgi:adenylyl-sulfate kinase
LNPDPLPPSATAGTIIWLTGLSGSGKTTIATELQSIVRRGGKAVCVLDGDELRRGVSSDLGFSPADRAENVRRVAEIARLMARAGLIVIVALISPFRQDRQKAREIACAGGVEFIEVFLDCPLAICEQRDPKGLYRKARAGELAAFTGVDAAYEAPQNAGIVLRTDTESARESISRLVAHLRGSLGLEAR